MSASNLTLESRTPEQAKADRDRKDRASWFPARHGSGEFGILSALDGREVCRCAKEADRDFILDCVRKAVAT